LRFLVAQPGPAFSVHDVYAGWVEALENAGQHVAKFNLDDRLAFYGSVELQVDETEEPCPSCGTPVEQRHYKKALSSEGAIELAVNGLYAALMKVRPHVLLVVSAFFTPPELLEKARAAGVKVVIVHTESPYEDERQLAVAAHADFNLVNDPTNLEKFRAVAPTEYACHAYRPSVHDFGDPKPDLASDLVFVGTGFPSRVEFFEQMAPGLDGLDMKLAGNWALLDDDSPLCHHVMHEGDCLDNTDTADLYRSAKVGLNLYRREAKENDSADGWAMGPREVEMAACGLPFVRDPRPEGDQLFSFLPTFESPEEAAEKIRWLLGHDGFRAVAREKARQAIADRTFDNHAAQLLRLLEKGVIRVG
jgi:spore maturation protein CgeB